MAKAPVSMAKAAPNKKAKKKANPSAENRWSAASSSSSSKHNQPQTKKKKLTTKPKHLQRKVAQARTTAEQDQLQKELVAFLKVKEQNKRTNQRNDGTVAKKKDSVGNNDNYRLATGRGDQVRRTQREDGGSRPLTKMTTREDDTPFPRNTAASLAEICANPESKSKIEGGRKRRRGRKGNQDDSHSSKVFSNEKSVGVSSTGSTQTSSTVTSPASSLIAPEQHDGVDDIQASTNKEASNDDEEDSIPASQKRTRGKRRRGRQDTSEMLKATASDDAVPNQQPHTPSSPTLPTEPSISQQNQPKKRYCLGRKPLTDFVVGQSYPGTVVYAKPYGVFLDIGCHVDAFCHVSRLAAKAQDFIPDPVAAFPPGHCIPHVRVVQVERKAKRLTVSLQSAERIPDAIAAAEAYVARREKKKMAEEGGTDTTTGSTSSSFVVEEQGVRDDTTTTSTVAKDSTVVQPQQKRQQNTTVAIAAPDGISRAEQKRARKLARRAARRAQAEDKIG